MLQQGIFRIRKHDCLLIYSVSDNYTFNVQTGEITEAQRKRFANMKGKISDLGAKVRDWWEMPIVQSQERTGYPTQKPLAMLDRIIMASSNEGDMDLEPSFGCATACVAAHNRLWQWIGIDVSSKAYDIIKQRITEGGRGVLLYNLIQRTDVPQRDDLGPLPPYNCADNRNKLYGEQARIASVAVSTSYRRI